MKPILFNTEMVRAILEGRKTVTRRVIKPHNPFRSDNYKQGYGLWIDATTDNGDKCGHIKDYSVSPCWQTFSYYIKNCAPYKVGDILYVRETWSRLVVARNQEWESERYVYKATDEYPFGEKYIVKFRWYPSIHMPKEAARIFLKVTDVRVERLQDITEDDVCEEGAEPLIGCDNEHPTYNADGTLGEMCWNANECGYCPFIEKSYSELFGERVWNSTIKKQDLDRYGWNANPWVWVLEFERFEKGGAE